MRLVLHVKSKKGIDEDHLLMGKPFINSQEQRQSVDFITNDNLDHEHTHTRQRLF